MKGKKIISKVLLLLIATVISFSLANPVKASAKGGLANPDINYSVTYNFNGTYGVKVYATEVMYVNGNVFRHTLIDSSIANINNAYLSYNPGTYSEAVKILQYLLYFQTGGTLEIRTDGYFGEQTRNAVIDFQRYNGLSADGIVGPSTWNTLVYKTKTN